MPGPTPSARQISAALALLGLSPAQLAASSGLSEMDVTAAEMGAADTGRIQAVRAALEAAGIVFLNGASPGVQVRPQPEGLLPEELNASNDG